MFLIGRRTTSPVFTAHIYVLVSCTRIASERRRRRRRRRRMHLVFSNSKRLLRSLEGGCVTKITLKIFSKWRCSRRHHAAAPPTSTLCNVSLTLEFLNFVLVTRHFLIERIEDLSCALSSTARIKVDCEMKEARTIPLIINHEFSLAGSEMKVRRLPSCSKTQHVVLYDMYTRICRKATVQSSSDQF